MSRRAVIVTDQIPGHQIGFERSGHGYYLETFVTFLREHDYEVTFVLIDSSIAFLRKRRDAFPFALRARTLGSSPTYVYPASARGFLKALVWNVYANVPRGAQSLVVRARTARRKAQGFAHVLGAYPSARDAAFVSDCVREISPELVLFDGLFNYCAVPAGGERWLISHDVKYERARSFAAQGYTVLPAGFDERIERDIIDACGNVIAIQWDEARTLARLAPQARVVTVPVAIATQRHATTAVSRIAGRCLFVGSGTFHNVDGLKWFLEQCWPLIRAAEPAATFEIVGSSGSAIDELPGRVIASGVVDDIARAYARARVAIVPLRVGSGLKVKLVEALAHGVPIVTTTVGAQGLSELDPTPFVVADDAAAFASAVVTLLRDDAANARLAARAIDGARRFSPAVAFDEFAAAIGI